MGGVSGPAARQVRADGAGGVHPGAHGWRGGAAEEARALVDDLADEHARGGLVVARGAHHALGRVHPLGAQRGHHLHGLADAALAQRLHGRVPVGVVRRAGAQPALVVRHLGEEVGDGGEDARHEVDGKRGGERVEALGVREGARRHLEREVVHVTVGDDLPVTSSTHLSSPLRSTSSILAMPTSMFSFLRHSKDVDGLQ